MLSVQAEHEIISHPPVVSTEDVKRFVEMGDGLPVKTLLFRRQEDRKLIVVVVPANIRVDTPGLAKQMGTLRLFFGSDRDVLASGFPLGGIAPFGFLPNSVERFFVDRRVLSNPNQWIYTGSGDNSKTLKIRSAHLSELISSYEQIDA